jgi:hypothetical protein
MRGERGQTAAEYLGALLVVATVIGAVATTDVGARVRHAVADKVCAIASGETTCAAAPPVHIPTGGDRRVLAHIASHKPPKPFRSAGAKTLGRLNAAARAAVIKALLHPWGDALKQADAAIAAYKRQVTICTDNDRRPPYVGCPGMTSSDVSVEDLLPLYDTVHAVHDVLNSIWQALTHPEPPPLTKEQKQAIQTFIVDAAAADGARTDEDVQNFFKAHKQDIIDGLDSFSKGETNWTGAQYIARGARNPALRNTIKELYRPGAKIGDGGTADALIDEASSGCGTRCPHYQKAVERVANLSNILRRQPLNPDETKIANELLNNLKAAIKKAGGP